MKHPLTERWTPMSPQLARMDLDQYHRMRDTGILHDGDPIELLDGLLIYKDRSARGEGLMTVGKHHNLAVQLLIEWAQEVRRRGCVLQVQGPVAIPPSHEPEPDGAILRGALRDYADGLPEARDVFCVIEVADSSLAQDRTVKLSLYAQAAVPCYLIVNLVDHVVERFDDPIPAEGRYGRKSVLTRDEVVVLT